MSQHHQESIHIEFRLRNIFDCGRGGYGGIADADFIDCSPYLTMVTGLTYNFKEKEENAKEKILKFISDYSHYSNYTMDEIAKENEEDFIKIQETFLKLS